MIKNWFLMKQKEIKTKLTFYSAIEKIMAEQKDFIRLLVKLNTALKNMSIEDLQKDFVSVVANIVHEDDKENKNT